MPVDDFARHVSDVLTRAHSLFGSGSAASPAAGAAEQLGSAADTARRIAAPDMSGSAVAGYRDFAHEKAAALTRLADADSALGGVLEDAAHAENAAAAASRAAVASAVAHSQRLGSGVDQPAGERALVAALQSQVRGQQDLVRRHQERTAELSERVRQVAW